MLLDELAVLATTFPRAKDARAVVTEGELDRYIGTLVDDDRFARLVAPPMLIRKLIDRAGLMDLNQVLRADNSSGKPIYFLPLQGQCNSRDAVDVHPWWALETTVKVCPKAYQPTHLKTTPGNLLCGVAPSDYCGCGPNLAFCARDPMQKEAILSSVREEVVSTVARVVKSDERIEQIYLANESERDKNVEFLYRRWRISAGEPADVVLAKLDEWPQKAVLAPRFESVPGQHAGILTDAGSVNIEASIRARMKWFYEALWCDEPPGGQVTTEAVLALKGNDLRIGDDWQELASRPICTECHARLDYGGQFFRGFEILFGYDPKQHLSGTGKLFAANATDYRGEAPLNPRDFAKLAVSQREFSECVLKGVKRQVLDDSWDATRDRALKDAFAERHSLKAMMRVALGQHAEERLRETCASTPAKVNTVELGLQTYCTSCHGKSRAPDFRDLSDKSTLTRALDAVAFGRMPRGPMSMASSDRKKLTELLIDRIWADERARTEARAYYASTPPFHVLPVEGILHAIDARAGAAPREPLFDGLDESDTRADLLRYTPGIETIISLEALNACKATGATGEELVACMKHASDVHGTTRGGTP